YLVVTAARTTTPMPWPRRSLRSPHAPSRPCVSTSPPKRYACCEHRDDLVESRTQIINRLHVLLTHLVAGGVQQALSAQLAADTLRTVRPTNALARTRKTIAAELVVDIRRLDQKIKRCDATLRQLVDASG